MAEKIFFGQVREIVTMDFVLVDDLNVFAFEILFPLVGFEKPFHKFSTPLQGILGVGRHTGGVVERLGIGQRKVALAYQSLGHFQ